MDKLGITLFHRKAIAEQLVRALLGDDALHQYGRSGLFLAAPRRTGKSTFLRNDLIPAIEATGALAVYVDLWADKTRDPAELIAEALRDKLSVLKKSANWLSRVRKIGVKAKLHGFEAELGFEIDTVGKPGGTTLVKAFEALRASTGKQIVLLVDEAQHALSTETGAAALFSLKAARDALNLTEARPGLAILATGSVRSKLSELVTRKSQAFYGAAVADFPRLGREFVEHLVRVMLSHRLDATRLPDVDKVLHAFDRLGRRPEELARAITLGVTRSEPDLGNAIVAAAGEIHAEIIGDLRKQFDALPLLQRSILRLMAQQGEAYAPFAKDSLARYQEEVGATTTLAMAQKALEGLVTAGHVWRSAAGSYAIDDEILAEYLFDPETRKLLTL